jgi:hypothetical protein
VKKGAPILLIIFFIVITMTGLAFVMDFSGKYIKIPTVTDPWCGKSIELRKIRFNMYRITWELVTGEKSVLDLFGKVDGDMLDFRKGKGDELYGYTYALADSKNRLVVTLTVPNKKVVCHFVREANE